MLIHEAHSSMSDVSSAESAALVLRYLETSAFPRTAGTFRRFVDAMLRNATIRCGLVLGFSEDQVLTLCISCREARQLLKSIVAPPTVKPLVAILNEYVATKEADIRRKQLMQMHPVVGDLLAVIENHAGKLGPTSQPSQAVQPAASEQQPPVAAGLDDAAAKPCIDGDMVGNEPSVSKSPGIAAEQHLHQSSPSHGNGKLPGVRLAPVTAKAQSSSQHRKGAPQRRTGQPDKIPSPISRLPLPSHGACKSTPAVGALANEKL